MLIFVVNLRVPIYVEPYDSPTPFNQRANPYQYASHTGVGAAQPANLWHECWVCPVLEVGIASANWLNFTEADVPIDDLCRIYNTTALQALGARRTDLLAQRPSRPAVQRVPVDFKVSDGDC